MKRTLLASTCLSMGLTGCVAHGEAPRRTKPRAGALRDQPSASQPASLPPDSRCVNSSTQRGYGIQGTDLWGMWGRPRVGGATDLIHSARLDSIRLDGRALVSARVEAGQLLTLAPGGKALAPEAFRGATLSGSAVDGVSLDLVICEVAVDPADRATRRYRVNYRHPETGEWGNICRGGVGQALVLGAVWSESGAQRSVSGAFTFACDSGVLGQMRRLGLQALA